jgi:hypothetical protein
MSKKFNEQDNNLMKKVIPTKVILFFLCIIVIASLITRIYFLNFEIPITHDALNYFFYALDIKNSNQLPINYSLANPGWGIFLSVFFSNFESQNIIDYMNLQKILTISISSFTILPMYLLCKKFFNKPYSLLGALIIGIEPHLIQNSLLGISDSLYILLIVISFLLYFNENKIIKYISFVIVGFCTIIRGEGIFILIPLLLMTILNKNKNKNKILDIIISGVIFSIIFLPMAVIQFEIYESDMAFGRAINTIEAHSIDSKNEGNITGLDFIFNGIENFPKYLGWNLIPIFLPFLPIGFLLIFKNWNYKIKVIFVSLIFMSLPPFYAYAISIQDGRYFFFLYPLFVILSILTIEKIGNKFNQKIILSVVISFIIISSGVYCGLKIENNFEEQIFISEIISKTPKVINDFSTSQYLEPQNYPDNFNEFKKFYELDRLNNESVRSVVPQKVSIISIFEYQNIENFIFSNKENLTHIVVENDQESILYDIFINEKNYPYLEKEFDSSIEDFRYEVKIFKINFEK